MHDRAWQRTLQPWCCHGSQGCLGCSKQRPEPMRAAGTCASVSLCHLWQTPRRSSHQVAREPRLGAAMSLGWILERPEGLRFGCGRGQNTWGLATGKVAELDQHPVQVCKERGDHGIQGPAAEDNKSLRPLAGRIRIIHVCISHKRAFTPVSQQMERMRPLMLLVFVQVLHFLCGRPYIYIQYVHMYMCLLGIHPCGPGHKELQQSPLSWATRCSSS